MLLKLPTLVLLYLWTVKEIMLILLPMKKQLEVIMEENEDPSFVVVHRVAEVAREHGWHPLKSLDSDENFKPKLTLFCLRLRFVAIYALFEDLWAKKVSFWVKNSVSCARSALIHGIYCMFQS